MAQLGTMPYRHANPQSANEVNAQGSMLKTPHSGLSRSTVRNVFDLCTVCHLRATDSFGLQKHIARIEPATIHD